MLIIDRHKFWEVGPVRNLLWMEKNNLCRIALQKIQSFFPETTSITTFASGFPPQRRYTAFVYGCLTFVARLA